MNFLQKMTARLGEASSVRKEIARLKAMEASMPGGLELVFYAESKNDWIYFEGLILELVEKRNRRIVYLTSSRDDKAFEIEHENLHPFYVGDGFARNVLFRSIACKILVMTLTDLDQLSLKRSIHDVHYVYLFHAILSAHMVYRERSFNAYDTFFAVGPHHEPEIHALHRFYDVERKEVIPFGYYRLEKIMEENSHLERRTDHIDKTDDTDDTDELNILIAPSWGQFSITRTIITPLIEELLKSRCRITFRPHPMSYRKDSAILSALRKKFGSNPAVHFDLDIRNVDSLKSADLMISDWSGSAFEFAFGFERPVLFVDTKPKINNGDFADFMKAQTDSLQPIEEELRTTLGDILDPSRLVEVNEKIRKLLADKDATHQKLIECRNEYIYNLGYSSVVGADHLIAIMDRN
jgi:hypothetical protein